MLNNDLQLLEEYESELIVDNSQQTSDNINKLDPLLLAEAEALATLSSNPGWKVLKSFIESQITSYSQKLIMENSFQEIRRIQEYLKACHMLLSYPEVKISEASSFVENISQQQNDLA